MIQRVQTLFLLAAIVVQILFISFPLTHFILADMNIDFMAIGFKGGVDFSEILIYTTPLYILSWAILFLSFVSIFLYKKRILQIRICIYNMLLNIGLIGMLILQISNFMKKNPVEAHSYTLIIAIPLVSIILLILAFRGIRKDELLLKAYDRLR